MAVLKRIDRVHANLNWFYNKPIDHDNMQNLGGYIDQPCDLAAFAKWHAEALSFSDDAQKQIKNLIIKLGKKAPVLQYPSFETINKKIADITDQYKANKKALQACAPTEMQALKMQLKLQGLLMQSGFPLVLTQLDTYHELTLLAEVIEGLGNDSEQVAAIENKLSELIYPNYGAEIADLMEYKNHLEDSQTAINNELPNSLCACKIGVDIL